jgi:ClpP class serine protease
LTGGSAGEVVSQLEMLKQSFLQAVMFQRGEWLKISKEELSKAGVYNGIEAVKYGLIDEIGSSEDAIQKTAELAGLRNYGVIDINDTLSISLPPWWEGGRLILKSSKISFRFGAFQPPLYFFTPSYLLKLA